jgi:RimJ/RimL family protein N-acetyltransferase
LETERLLLDGWREADVEPLAAMNADAQVMRHIGSGVRPYARALAEARQFVAGPPTGPLGLWAIRERGGADFCGWAALMPLDGGEEIELGYRLPRHGWGRGIATEAAGRLLAHGFSDLGLERIVAVTSAENVASQRVLTKLGLQYRGLREVYGVKGVWYYDIRAAAWRRLFAGGLATQSPQ